MSTSKDTLHETRVGLTGKLLIAMPALNDERFQQAVIFICTHSDEGAMGIIINKPMHDVTLGDILDQLDINTTPEISTEIVHYGGPVESGQGFILHTPDYENDMSTMPIGDDYAMTATRDILEVIANGTGPSKSLNALGYAGWSPGQLESELQQNSWLTCDPETAIIFDTLPEKIWTASLRKLGVDPRLLSATGGSA
jgi:putative transcriptional regulator